MAEYIYRTDTDFDGVDVYIRTGELVRCKDCKYYLDEIQKACDLTYSIIKPNGYCSYGERRTDEID